MKKLLALALAAAMVLGLGSVVFAADEIIAGFGVDWYKFSSDRNTVTTVTTDLGTTATNANNSIQYGNTIYKLLVDSAGDYIQNADAVKSLSIKQKWDYGKEIVDSIAVIKKKDRADGQYKYWLTIKLKANPTATAATDVIGSITLKKSTGDYAIAPDANGKNEVKLDVNVAVKFSDLGTDFANETRYILKDGIGVVDEDTLEMGDLAYFESDFDGQGKVVVYYDNKYNAAIASKYPAANIDFFNGNYATFNKIGDFTLYADPGTYLYYVAEDGTISKMDAEYDDYEEAFKFRTRVLGKYLISDIELGLAAATPVTAVVGAPAAVTAAPTEIKTVPVTGV